RQRAREVQRHVLAANRDLDHLVAREGLLLINAFHVTTPYNDCAPCRAPPATITSPPRIARLARSTTHLQLMDTYIDKKKNRPIAQEHARPHCSSQGPLSLAPF
ncbi:MAG: hypothetical protein ACK56F_25605, partial [bacterium]